MHSASAPSTPEDYRQADPRIFRVTSAKPWEAMRLDHRQASGELDDRQQAKIPRSSTSFDDLDLSASNFGAFGPGRQTPSVPGLQLVMSYPQWRSTMARNLNFEQEYPQQ